MNPSPATILGLLTLAIVSLSVIAFARRAKGGPRGPRINLLHPVPKGVWWVTGLLTGALVYFARARLEAAGAGWAFFGLLMGVAAVLFVLCVLVLTRPRHQKIARAMARARSGEVGAAVVDLQRQIETQGRSARRSGALGDCHLLQEQWREAYIQFVDAEQLDGRAGRYLAKQAFALWKLERGSEAIALLEQAARQDPRNPSHAWTACLILADLGRVSEAREHLDRAERLAEEWVPVGTVRRRALEDSIELCRERLARLPNSTTKSTPPD